ncbi:hypothetical protein GCM10023149_47440 [Mucilaginibacter gynuensis]|uniref:Uncharacterized protein n=1 Tax=Mucilaginibacter gynuensis TaxID=1302236 RepID=A0ABP8HDA4_9SPHI
MSTKEVPHIITNEEIERINALGFEITGSTAPLVDFLNEYFAGFHIGEYLAALENLLGSLTQVTTTKELSFHESPPPMLIIQYYSDDNEDDQLGLAFS